LPSTAFAVAREASPAALPPPEIDPHMLEGIRVLVVDDDEDARDLLKTSLGAYGADVVTAGSAAEAMTLFDRHVPDVLLSDIGMQYEDGYSLMRRVRARPAARGGLTPAVALTAYATPADREAAFAAGYQAHVAKPFEPAYVASLVDQLAQRRRDAQTRR
jgi:CheY-like chemotaxis protein